MFSYLRYNAELTREGLDDLGLHDVQPGRVQRLDSIEHIEELQQVGRRVGLEVSRDHFDGFL
jgi:hypothetical protein